MSESVNIEHPDILVAYGSVMLNPKDGLQRPSDGGEIDDLMKVPGESMFSSVSHQVQCTDLLLPSPEFLASMVSHFHVVNVDIKVPGDASIPDNYDWKADMW